MIKRCGIFYAIIFLIYGGGTQNVLAMMVDATPSTGDQKLILTPTDSLMAKLKLASIGSLSGYSAILNIKQRANNALAKDFDSEIDETVFESSATVWGRDEFDNSQEAPDAAETKKLISAELHEQMVVLVQNFFKSQGFAKTKQNLGIFRDFVFSCSSWLPHKQEQAVQTAIELCNPENCFKQDNVETEYIYENDTCIGARITARCSQVLFKTVTLEVHYAYVYLFDYTEKRMLGLKGQPWAPYYLLNAVKDEKTVSEPKFAPMANILTQDVCVAPGCLFIGEYTFICEHESKNGTAEDYDNHELEAAGYSFAWHDCEKISLIDKDILLEKIVGQRLSLIGKQDLMLDIAVGEVPAYLDNCIFYKNWLKPVEVKCIFKESSEKAIDLVK